MTGHLCGELTLVGWIFELYEFATCCRGKSETDALIGEMDRLKKCGYVPRMWSNLNMSRGCCHELQQWCSTCWKKRKHRQWVVIA